MVATRGHPTDFATNTSSSASSTREQSVTRSSPGKWAHIPSALVITWLLVSVPLVIWDTGYVLLRPHSMPGGKLHWPWTPYALYGLIDHVYGWPAFNSGSGFTAAQALLNVVETLFYIYYLTVVWTRGQTLSARGKAKKTNKSIRWYLTDKKAVSGREGAVALLVVFSACVMTLSKTILYTLNEVCSGFEGVGHNDPFTLLFMWIMPNGSWIVFPAIGTYYFGHEIVDALETASGVAGSKSKAS